MLKSKVSVKLAAKNSYKYPIYIDQNLIDNYNLWLDGIVSGKKIIVITDNTVLKLHAKSFVEKLKKSAYDVLVLNFAAGEQSKNYATFENLLDEMLKNKCDRHSLCIAFGGGVVGDMTGFVASVFMRGIKYIQVPTTLLSMIDSSVGGKTAINSKYGKNLIGAFYQPNAVVMDVGLLKTLPQDQFINGLIEAIKIFLTSDLEFFKYTIEQLDNILNRNDKSLVKVIKRAVQLKAQIVSQDEKEENLRMILNFGHTVGHAIEKLSSYKIAHGYAVALGILVEAKIAVLLKKLDIKQYLLIEKLFIQLGIDTSKLKRFKIEDMIDVMLSDKKNKNGKIYMILLSNIGKVNLTDNGKVATSVDSSTISNALSTFGL